MSFLFDVLSNGVFINLAWVICHVIRSILLRKDRNLTKTYQVARTDNLLHTKLVPLFNTRTF